MTRFALIVALLCAAPAFAQESAILDGSLIERCREAVEASSHRVESAFDRHGERLEHFGNVIDRVGTVLRGVWWVVVAGVVAYCMRQLVDLVNAVGVLLGRRAKP